VLVSLALITVYFRESSGGALHDAQRIGLSVLRPFEVAGERVSRPFRDAWGWASDLFDAKDENEKLRGQVEALRQELIQSRTAAQENDATSVLNHSRRLLRWRKQQPALVTGGVRAVPLSEPLFAIERATGDDRVLAVFNLEDRPVRVARESLPDCAPLDGHGFTGVLTGRDLSLGPHDAFFARIPH